MEAKDFDKKFDEGKEEIVDDLDLQRHAVQIESKNALTSIFHPGLSILWTVKRLELV